LGISLTTCFLLDFLFILTKKKFFIVTLQIYFDFIQKKKSK
jgi:hypothetical protein